MRWWRRRRILRQARKHVRDIFDEPSLLQGTSLRPSHRGRIDVVDIEVEEDQLQAVLFTILRHPRPHPFSRQFHAVVQLYRYDLVEGTVRHVKSLNLSRLRGGDGEPPGGGGI